MKETSKDQRRGAVSLRLLAGVAVFCALPIVLFAQGPAWWTSRGVLNGNPANDYGPANQGQVKNVAVEGINELNANLPGGAGPVLNQLAIQLSGTTADTNDFAPVNLGQLKAVAQPFYDRLISVGYTNQYPWLSSTNQPDDYAMANVGQMKNAFNFDMTYDSTGKGVPDWWERKYYGNNTNAWVSGTAIAPNGDGLTIQDNYEQGINPNDYFSGKAVDISIVGGDGQVGMPTSQFDAPLIVAVTDIHGNPLANAPVTFLAPDGAVVFQTTSGGTGGSTSITVRTGTNGYAQVFITSVFADPGSNRIDAYPVTQGAASRVTFNAITSNDALPSLGDPVLNPPPLHNPGAGQQTNVTSVLNPDGSIDINWTNSAVGTDPIEIKLKKGDGTWRTATSVPAGSTSVHIPPQ